MVKITSTMFSHVRGKRNHRIYWMKVCFCVLLLEMRDELAADSISLRRKLISKTENSCFPVENYIFRLNSDVIGVSSASNGWSNSDNFYMNICHIYMKLLVFMTWSAVFDLFSTIIMCSFTLIDFSDLWKYEFLNWLELLFWKQLYFLDDCVVDLCVKIYLQGNSAKTLVTGCYSDNVCVTLHFGKSVQSDQNNHHWLLIYF